jgi:hypothetical protein
VIHWPSYNKSLVRRGEILFSYDFLDIWDVDLVRMNENKKGKKYKFPDSFILIVGHIRVYLYSITLIHRSQQILFNIKIKSFCSIILGYCLFKLRKTRIII